MKRFRQIFITVVIFLLLFSAVAYGDTWTTNKRLTNNAGWSSNPAIAVNGSNIYVVWRDNTPGNSEIYFKKSVDGGVTWKTDKRLTNNVEWSSNPAIAVDGPNIYVVWTAYTSGGYEIYFKKSVDGGATWTTDKRLSYTAGESLYPAIAVDGSNIYVVWEDHTPDYYQTNLYFKKSFDGGNNWTTKRRLSYTAGGSYYPAIAVDASNIYVVWQDYTPGDYELYFKKSDDGGVTWTKTKMLTFTMGYSQWPAIAVDASNIYVVWQDYTPGNYEIYFKKSGDGGATWTTDRRLTNDAGQSYEPAIAVYGSKIYVVWADNAPGNFEIYFKKGVMF
jgi:hypothetical protein